MPFAPSSVLAPKGLSDSHENGSIHSSSLQGIDDQKVRHLLTAVGRGRKKHVPVETTRSQRT